jgi:hypothetical protein
MFHPIVDHQPETLRMYSLHFGDGKGSLRTVSKHFLYLLKKTETVFICKLRNLFNINTVCSPSEYFCPLETCRYSPHAPQATPSTRLACAASDDWSKDSAILHSRKSGVGFDSSHRNKNENFAPVTILTTVNDFGRMVPSKQSVDATAYLKINFLSQLLSAFLRIFRQVLWYTF